ncbi:hypothetical protein KJ359_011067 [Pestalotiopsis sp. 9143b]|nr:hypothetical protein KJ359_011067 [Pestalotiopsis sp. 9143b]
MSQDDEFSFILTEALALANGGGAATSEVLRIASQIVPGDLDSWYREFHWMAEQIHGQAQQARTATSKRQALFRASSYYRLSNFFLTANASDPRLFSIWDTVLDTFHEAISYMPIPGENYTVQGPGYEIPGYLFKAQKGNDSKVPTVVVGSGYDAAQEDSWHALGQEVLDRGWNFVTYEGPGQPTVRRQQGLGFVPEWWDVVTPVVDWLATRDDVDMDNVALVGISFGGQLAPLAASREHRLKAVLSIDGLYSIQKALLDQFGQLATIFASGNATLFDQAVAYELSQPDAPTNFKWITGQGLWTSNTTSYYDWVKQLGAYTVTQETVNNITAYPWVGRGENDDLVGGQEPTLAGYYNASPVGHDAAYHVFSTDLGAGLHCQLGAEQQLAQSAFDWLDEIFSM